MTVFIWVVTSVDVSTEVLAGHDDVVTVVYWKCSGEQDGYTAYLERNSVISYDPATYVPYADLTEAQVLGWVFAAGNTQANTEAEIQQMLDAQITPTVVSPELPWAV
jgi:hypothetical protein